MENHCCARLTMFIKDHFLIAPPSIHTVITPPQCGGLDGCEHPKGGQCLKVVKMYHGHLFHHQPAHHCLSYHTAPVALCRAVSSPSLVNYRQTLPP